MEQRRQVDVFATCARHRCPELAVAERAAEGQHAATNPEQHHEGGIPQLGHEEARRREDPDPDHAGNNEIGGGEEPERSRENVRLVVAHPVSQWPRH
jgi:hypothetical protein